MKVLAQQRVVFSVSIDRNLAEYLRKLKARGINVSRLVELALKNYIVQHPILSEILKEEDITKILA